LSFLRRRVRASSMLRYDWPVMDDISLVVILGFRKAQSRLSFGDRPGLISLSFRKKIKHKFISLIGSVACLIAIVLSSYVQFQENSIPLIIILVFIFLALIGRPFILKKMDN
jgi:hypothetical protein